VLYLIYHDFHESRKPGYEYKFVQQLSNFMQERQKNVSRIDELVPAALKMFYDVFRRAKIERCTFYTLEGSLLEAKDHYFVPPTTDARYCYKLTRGVGVAGKVCQDQKARYVPRLFWPVARPRRWASVLFFPHAVIFDFRPGKNGSAELFHKGLDPFAFTHQTQENSNMTFRSIVSVPVKSVSDMECFGVMNFDFVRYDPLDKSDIAMAMVFGLLLGDEIRRLRDAAVPTPSG
jgi:hypothetical protein